MRIMEDISYLSFNHLHGVIGSQRQIIAGFLPIRSDKNRVPRILFQHFFNQSIQNGLFIFKMAVKRCFPNTDGVRNLGNRGGFKPIHRKQIQRCFQNLLFCVSPLHNEISFTAIHISLPLQITYIRIIPNYRSVVNSRKEFAVNNFIQ